MDNNTTNKREAKGSETLNHQVMIKHVIALFRDTMPFNQLLGLEFVTEGEGLDTQISLHLNWQPSLTGNPMQKILHGGVTATMLDTIGGLVSIIETIKQTAQEHLADLQVKLPTMGTVDMRVDYLRPGRGERFVATATIIRKGSKLVVCRMELHNEKGDHIAFGTGTYMLG